MRFMVHCAMTKKSRSFEDDTEPVSSPVQVMILTLFFQLLVFFILMNSISAFSKKAGDVLKSMQQSFGDGAYGRIEAVGVAPELTSGAGTGMSLTDIGGLFQNEMPGLKTSVPSRSGVLEITLPASEFNRMLGLTGAGRVNPQLMTLIEFIRTYPKVDYRLQLLKNIRPDILRVSSRRLDPTSAYLVVWDDALTQLGLPTDKFEYGVAAGPAGTITLRITALRDLTAAEILP
jgi:hypothetical protein